MSDLQKAWAKSKLLAPDAFDEREEEDEEGYEAGRPGTRAADDDSSSAHSTSSTDTVKPSASRKLFARPQGGSRGRAYEPVPWTAYFERELYLKDESDPSAPTLHAYLSSPAEEGALFVTHHGAGSSGLSFALLGAEIRKRAPAAGMLSLDARGHGSTRVCAQDEALDLSIETLSKDLLSAIQGAQAEMKWAQLPPIVLVGHSLGGAVVTELANSGALGRALLGYAVIDVVEGSAIDALQYMQANLLKRPTGFPSLEAGIEWHLRSRTITNAASARASVPALLWPREPPEQGWTWVTDLASTEPFWSNWFLGLSKKFLEATGAKLLLLAGADRLDKELTIGQMQGKFAMQLFPEAGHFIHEDYPDKIAESLVDFQRRNDRSALVLPPKVSDLLRQGKKV